MNTSYYNQFGFKYGHSTDMCIFALKQTLQFYNGNRSPVYTCFLDASKAFDRVNNWTMFKKLCDRNVPKAYTRVLMVW